MTDSDNGGYFIKIVVRDHQGQIKDDYHATVTRLSDGKQLVYISGWRWVLKIQTRRKALDRDFKHAEKREKKLAKVENIER